MFADRFGRKPVMVVGVIATGVFAITFGLSTTLGSAMASRLVSVAFGGGGCFKP